MKSTTRFNKNNRGKSCLNCHSSISDTDNFCPNCGQVNDLNPLSLKTYFSEYLSGFFSFDNRLFKTVIPLIFKPGKVTQEFISGKRKRYVNPFQLYLHITILFFLLQGIYSTIDEFKVNQTNTIEQKEDDSSVQASIVLDSLSVTDTDLQKDPKNNSKKVKIEQFIDSVLAVDHRLDSIKNPNVSTKTKDSLVGVIYQQNLVLIADLFNGTLENGTINASNIEDIADISELQIFGMQHLGKILVNNGSNYQIPERFKSSIQDSFFNNILGNTVSTKLETFIDYADDYPDLEPEEALVALNYPTSRWNVFYYKKAQNIVEFKNKKEYRQSLADAIISKISVALFLLLPVFTLIVALLYFRNRNTYTEHLIFVFHTQTVFFILLMLLIFIGRFIAQEIMMILFFILFGFYLYKALRNFYGQGRIKTFIKYCILTSSFIVLATIGFTLISFISFLL